MLPPSVANELRHQRPVPAKKYECVTLLFSGIVGFNDYCAKNADSKGAMKIVKLLNNLYTTFDVLTDPKKNPDVYKVQFFLKIIFQNILTKSKKFNLFHDFYIRLKRWATNIWPFQDCLNHVNHMLDV